MKLWSILLISMILGGCAATSQVKPVVQKNDVVIDGLSSVATEIREEMKRLNANSSARGLGEDIAVAGCTARPVSIDFDGDVMLFIEDLRKSRFCDIRITGKKPHQQLVLSLHHKKVPLWKVLEDAGVQLGRMASVTVSANSVAFNFGAGAN